MISQFWRRFAQRSDEPRRVEPESSPAFEQTGIEIELLLEGGPVHERELRFQAVASLPLHFKGREQVRVRANKLSGPPSVEAKPTWQRVDCDEGTSSELVIDGLLCFDDAEREGRSFGRYELEVEVRLGRLVGIARKTFDVAYVEPFRRPAHEIFSGSSTWSTTSRAELRGEGVRNSTEPSAIRLRQSFAEHEELSLRMSLRYERDAAPGFLEIRMAEHFATRFCPGAPTPVELFERNTPIEAQGDGSPLFAANAEQGALRLEFRVRREKDRTRLLVFVDGLLARSAYVSTPLPEWPWTIVLGCSGMTVLVDALEAGPLAA